MKWTLTALIFCALSTTARAQDHTGIEAFDWLVGTWENLKVKPGETAHEVWTDSGEGFLTGIGVTIRGTDTVFIEKLKIHQKHGRFAYVADVSHNAAPVSFQITQISANGFTAENPQHDFPRKIEYLLDGDVLIATISAGEKRIPFRFRRKD